MVSKVCAKLVNNKIVDHLEKWGLFSYFQCGFRSSRPTADFLTVVSHRIAKSFNRSEATQSVALDISKAFGKVWHTGLPHRLKSYGISGQVFDLISSFLRNIRLCVVLDGLMQEFLKASFLVLHFSCYALMTFLMLSGILLSMLMILCDQASDLWRGLELASELESDR